MSLKSFRCVKLFFREDEKVPYYIYFKNHAVDKKNGMGLVNGRTIFVCNIPPFLSEEKLKYIFENLKKVKKIILWGCQNDLELIEKYEPLIEYFEIKKIYAYIEFNEEITGADFNRFIKTNSFKLYEIDDIVVPHTKFLDPNKLLESLLKYQKVEIKHPISNEPDEDGWITVGGKDKLTSLPFKQKPEPKNKNEDDSLCIYAFRRRQIQEEKISLLRRKFEEDKQKVALMRTKRIFKPL